MCGYCEPGFIMAIAALIQASPSPSKEAIDRAAKNLSAAALTHGSERPLTEKLPEPIPMVEGCPQNP